MSSNHEYLDEVELDLSALQEAHERHQAESDTAGDDIYDRLAHTESRPPEDDDDDDASLFYRRRRSRRMRRRAGQMAAVIGIVIFFLTLIILIKR